MKRLLLGCLITKLSLSSTPLFLLSLSVYNSYIFPTAPLRIQHAVAIKLKLYAVMVVMVVKWDCPYKHIAVCLVDKPGGVLSKAVLGQFPTMAAVVSRLRGEGGRGGRKK